MNRAKNSPGCSDLGSAFKYAVADPGKARQSIDIIDKMPVMMEPEDALALKIQCDLSDDQYQLIRNSALKQNANIYPTLHSILVAKSNCYPKEIEITETSAKCTLQSMVDHTASRILDQSMDKLQSMDARVFFI